MKMVEFGNLCCSKDRVFSRHQPFHWLISSYCASILALRSCSKDERGWCLISGAYDLKAYLSVPLKE